MLCLSGFELYSRWVPLKYELYTGTAQPSKGRLTRGVPTRSPVISLPSHFTPISPLF